MAPDRFKFFRVQETKVVCKSKEGKTELEVSRKAMRVIMKTLFKLIPFSEMTKI